MTDFTEEERDMALHLPDEKPNVVDLDGEDVSVVAGPVQEEK